MIGALRSDATALDAVADLLGPEHPAGRPHRHAVLPSPSRPRYVVPATGSHARAAHFRPSGSSRRDLLTRAVIRPALRAGLGRVLPGGLVVPDGTDADPSLRRHLAELLDRPDLELVVALGAPRPNRKPVLQVVGADGTTAAWVKLGVDAHTDALVAHETEALTARRPGSPVVTPDVAASGTWRGHPFLALAHMQIDESAADIDIPAAAIRAIAGPTTREPVLESAWWQGLRGESATVDPDGVLGALLDAAGPALAGRTWEFGAWHGDLAPWNAAWRDDELVVWDWERSTAPVPLGLDLVHDRIQVGVLRDGQPLAEAVARAGSETCPTLVALGHAEEDITALVVAYLLTLRARYLGDAVLGPLGPGAAIAAAIDADLPHLARTTTP